MYSLRECRDKPIDGKERQDIIHWLSDYPIGIEEVRESGWREGGSGNALGFKGDICWASELGDGW